MGGNKVRWRAYVSAWCSAGEAKTFSGLAGTFQRDRSSA
jgi:hypothetical protein